MSVSIIYRNQLQSLHFFIQLSDQFCFPAFLEFYSAYSSFAEELSYLEVFGHLEKILSDLIEHFNLKLLPHCSTSALGSCYILQPDENSFWKAYW